MQEYKPAVNAKVRDFFMQKIKVNGSLNKLKSVLYKNISDFKKNT